MQARAQSPAIIFIDEIDSVGRIRCGLAALALHTASTSTLAPLALCMLALLLAVLLLVLVAVCLQAVDPLSFLPCWDGHGVFDRPRDQSPAKWPLLVCTRQFICFFLLAPLCSAGVVPPAMMSETRRSTRCSLRWMALIQTSR